MFNKIKQKGFTLIELLVVIAIIGLLATIVMVSVNSARMKARDVKRKGDIRQMRLALEMYYDSNGRYPTAGACAYGSNCYVYSTAGTGWLPALVGTYMSSLPLDPTNNASAPWTTGNYSYSYENVDTNGQSFDLTAQLENTSDSDRCELKCYKFYFDNRNWCCSGGGYSNQIFEDSPLTP